MIGFLKLVRLPNVFTALSNVLGAWAVVTILTKKQILGLASIESSKVILLLISSASLYMAGMAFNDIADREEDAKIRPNRPIPSGAVSLNQAILCGVALLLIGLSAAMKATPISIYFALPLAAAILFYDFVAKRGKIPGIASLGVCRFLNVLLGLSLAATSTESKLELNLGSLTGNSTDPLSFLKAHNEYWIPPLAIGLYAAGITAFSAQEEAGKRNTMILLGWVLVLAGMGFAYSSGLYAMFGLIPLTAWLVRCTINLIKDGGPLAARDLVRSAVMGVCVVDASLVLGFGGKDWIWAACLIALLPLPGIMVAKWLTQKEA